MDEGWRSGGVEEWRSGGVEEKKLAACLTPLLLHSSTPLPLYPSTRTLDYSKSALPHCNTMFTIFPGTTIIFTSVLPAINSRTFGSSRAIRSIAALSAPVGTMIL